MFHKLIKLSAALLLMVSSMSMKADDNTSMLFECNDGSIYSINAENLSITISDNKLVASNSSKNLELQANNVTRFFFSSDSGIEGIIGDGQPVEIYSVSGIELGTFQSVNESRSMLTPGIYIVKIKEKTYKLHIK